MANSLGYILPADSQDTDGDYHNYSIFLTFQNEAEQFVMDVSGVDTLVFDKEDAKLLVKAFTEMISRCDGEQGVRKSGEIE